MMSAESSFMVGRKTAIRRTRSDASVTSQGFPD
jgi:hypothetical protein